MFQNRIFITWNPCIVKQNKKKCFSLFFSALSVPKNITIPYFRFPDEVLSLYFRENESVIVFEKYISENIWRQTRKAISSLLLKVPLVCYINNFRSLSDCLLSIKYYNSSASNFFYIVHETKNVLSNMFSKLNCIVCITP